MEAVKPKRSRQQQKKKQQQAWKKSDYAADVATSLATADGVQMQRVKRVGVKAEGGAVGESDAEQLRTERTDSSGSASSDTAEEHFLDADMDAVEADIIQDMLAAMGQDMEQSAPRSDSEISSREQAVTRNPSVEGNLQDEEMKKEVIVTDYEIAQNEDDLLSFLGAAPMSSNSPYASMTSPPKRIENVQHLTIEIPAEDPSKPPVQGSEPSGETARLAAAAAKPLSATVAHPEQPNAVELTVDAPQTPSAPAFDEDHNSFAPSYQAPQALQKTYMRTLSAPSAPNFNDSDDEHPSVMTLDVPHVPSPPMVPVLKKPTDGLVAAGAPEGFPDSSPSGPRVTTPSAPPEIDLDDPKVGSEASSALAGYPNSSPSRTKTPMPSAPPEIDSNTSSPVKTASFTASAPPEIDVHAKASAQKTSGVPSAPTMPSLSPTATKTISRASSGTDVERSAPESSKVKSPMTAENVGNAVRNSFAKVRMLEASRNLYPSVPQSMLASTTRAAGGSSFAQVSVDGQVLANGALAARQKRIHIKLEPFVNFEMNLMRAEASQKRQEMKMQRIETNKGELHSRLERYLYSEYLLHTAASSLETSKTEVDTLMKKGNPHDVPRVMK